MRRADLAVPALLVGAGAALVAVAPPAPTLAALSRGLDAGTDPTALAVAVIAGLTWVMVGWLALAVAAALASRVPGATGRAAARLARRISPAVVRRLVGAATAAGVALAPVVVPTLASAAPAPAPCTSALPSLDRAPLLCPPPPAVAATPPARAASPAPHPAPHPTPPAAPAPGRAGTSVTVRPGDTLWSIAAAELRADHLDPSPPAVAARWPAWWQANRAVVGDDPDLIHAGAALVPPATAPEETR